MVDSKVSQAWIKNLTSDHEFICFGGHSICQTLRFFCLSGFDLYFHPLRSSRLYCAPLFPFWNDFTRLKRKKRHYKAFLHLKPNHAYRFDKLKFYDNKKRLWSNTEIANMQLNKPLCTWTGLPASLLTAEACRTCRVCLVVSIAFWDGAKKLWKAKL